MSQNETRIANPVEYNTVLNPKIWDHDRIKGEVKGALLRIAEDFREFCDIDFEVLDIIITGGNVNYTYTAKSDIDLHLVADFDSIACDRELAELFDTKRLLYKRDHDVTVYGIPVELYVEDNRTPAVSAGAYSLTRDQWLKKPQKQTPQYDPKLLEQWVIRWRRLIQQAMQTGDLQACRTVLKLLRAYRRRGLATSAGEFSIPNLVYKSLRNDNTIKAITILVDRLHDQSLSI